jgi:uncharacterized protein
VIPGHSHQNCVFRSHARSTECEEGRLLATQHQGNLDLSDRSGSDRISRVRLENIPAWQLFWTESPSPNDPFLRDLIASEPIQRLRNVGFLGAIDYLIHSNGQAPHRRRHNRFDHSVNVAFLALRYAALRGLKTAETRLLASAALLHDVGHGPLSHTLEPTFRLLFGINHHQAGQAIIKGDSSYGAEIPRIFAKHGADVEEVLALLSGTHGGSHAFLFDSPINLDTIEAIARCCLFSRVPQLVPPTEFVDAIATSEQFPVGIGDRFWASKEVVYKTLIGSRIGLAADALAQRYMMAESAKFAAGDFYLNDLQLRKRHPDLFVLFETVRSSSMPESGCRRLWSFDFDFELETSVRQFRIDNVSYVRSTEDLKNRYIQTKTSLKMPLKSVITLGHECTEQQVLYKSTDTAEGLGRWHLGKHY